MNKLLVICIMLIFAFLFTACTEPDGPAEQAGEKIDQTIEKSTNAMDDAAEKAAEKIEEAGDVIREKTE
ncbi:MAG: hypothetical protein P1U35_13175 [Cycloclasticus sp.]|nr:hypothetical protein [Cycloclasticus sp.]